MIPQRNHSQDLCTQYSMLLSKFKILVLIVLILILGCKASQEKEQSPYGEIEKFHILVDTKTLSQPTNDFSVILNPNQKSELNS